VKIVLLGTGTSLGVPMIGCDCEVCHSSHYKDKRLRSSAYFELEGLGLQIDIGPDFRQQMLLNRISKIDAVLLTHEHADHTSGMDEIRGFNFSQKMSIPFYGEQRVVNDLRQRFDYIFKPVKYSGLPAIELKEISGLNNFSIKETEIMPLSLMHGNLPILGYRIRNAAYITDASFLPEETITRLQGLEVLIINALRQTSHHSHLSLKECLVCIEQIKPKKAYITHISHQMGLHDQIESTLPDSVHLAYDGLIIYT